MKKWLSTLLILVMFLLASKANGQVYTQTFIDKCTGKTKTATTTYVNGNAVVSFYDQIKTFTSAGISSPGFKLNNIEPSISSPGR